MSGTAEEQELNDGDKVSAVEQRTTAGHLIVKVSMKLLDVDVVELEGLNALTGLI